MDIPVLMACDENYILQTYITIISVLENASAEDKYKFYILIPECFSENYLKKGEAITEKYANATIEYMEMKDAFNNIKTIIAHITTPTYYRLKAPSLFPQYDKMIYLDSDVIVEGNLKEYYSIDMDNFYVAGVKAPVYHLNKNGQVYCQKNDLPALDQYINVGTLLMNLKALRDNNIEEKFLYGASKGYSSQDQDVINVACYGHIKHLEYKYNCMISKYERRFGIDDLKRVFNENEIKEAHNNPFIIHFVDTEKPWNSLTCPMADRWWKYAELASFFELFLLNNFHSLIVAGQKARLELLEYNRTLSDKLMRPLKDYLTARIDIKLLGNSADLQLQSLSDEHARVTEPQWILSGGKGYVIEAYNRELDIYFKVNTGGELKINLRGVDVKDKEGKRIPVWINYIKFRYNGTTEFEESQYAWHDQPIKLGYKVKSEGKVHLHIEWLPCKIDDPELLRRLETRLKNAEKELGVLKSRNADINKKLQFTLSREADLKNSLSFRVARAITWIPRKICGKD